MGQVGCLTVSLGREGNLEPSPGHSQGRTGRRPEAGRGAGGRDHEVYVALSLMEVSGGL